MRKVTLFLLLLIYSTIYSQNLRTLDKDIVDENNNEIILRSAGLGGWMLQEPYMFNYSSGANTQHEFKEKLNNLVGSENTELFFESWLDNFVTEQDVDSIASWGFNSIRLPMHYDLFTLSIQEEPVEGENTWLDRGFEIVDQLLDWCEQNELYLILDLHAAPGGQGYDAAISDYNSNYPSLWESVENQNKTIALWEQLAIRYKDEPWIGGYDLLNETNWDLANFELRSFYVQVTNAIREHDSNHIIFIEGNWFANDFTGLIPPWDDNMAYSFHKYWSYNNTESIQWVLDIRNQYNTPLWMGESGENSNLWFTDAIRLFEDNEIGWAWWPWKKTESINSTLSISSNSNFQSIINYFADGQNQPSIENAMQGLMQFSTDSRIENAHYNSNVIDAMMRQPHTNETLAYSENLIPGVIYLTDYDLGTEQYAYSDVISGTYQVSTDEYTTWNNGWSYRNDGVDIQESNDSESNGYNIGWVEDGEWLLYTIDVQQSGFYDIITRYSSEQNGGKIKLFSDDLEITDYINLYNSGGYSNFINRVTANVYLSEGSQKLKLKIKGDVSFNLSKLEFFESNDENPEFEVLLANTLEDEKSIKIVLTHPLASQNLEMDLFDLKLNDESTDILAVEIDSNNSQVINVITENYMSFQDEITISYNGDGLLSETGQYLYSFQDYPVENNLSTRLLIPGRIQAEDFYYQEGLETEETSDTFGGLNIGYTDQGDFADYLVAINDSGDYSISFRVASEGSGSLKLEIINDTSTENIGVISTPNTGGWQNWQTISFSTYLPEGLYTLRMTVIQSPFNLNWMDFESENGNNNSNEELVEFLSSGTWRIQAEADNYRGVGPGGAITAEWWSASALSESNTGLYDDTWTFSETGVLSVNTGADEAIFGKKPEIDAAFDPNGNVSYDADNEFNEYFNYPLTNHTDQYNTSNDNDSEETITFNSYGNLGFYTALNNQTYQILSRTSNTMSVRNVGSEGNSWYSTLTTDEQLSTVELNNMFVRIFPNPTNTDFIYIKSSLQGVKVIELFDINGRRIIQTKINGDKLNIGNLNHGLYLIKIMIQGQINFTKILVN
jgi:hypothetical protein